MYQICTFLCCNTRFCAAVGATDDVSPKEEETKKKEDEKTKVEGTEKNFYKRNIKFSIKPKARVNIKN